ncbi:MAG: UbiA family prenyltransferase [Elusimicrobiota bacterium]
MGKLREMLKEARPHQWVKNLLVFVPLVTSHRLAEAETFASASRAFLALGFCASAVYVMNDLFDLCPDRAHPAKRERPFASGRLPLSYGPPLAAGLLLASLAAGWGLPFRFWGVLALYLGLTTAYTLRLRDTTLVDVFCLAAFYTLRVIAGHAVTDIPYSPWLSAFCMFFFLGLAVLKRYAELLTARGAHRGYRAGDEGVLLALGTACGALSVLVFALYINTRQVALLYTRPALLWLICPLLLYWIGRVWFLVQRGEVEDDPVVFALKDRTSYAVGVLVASLLFAAAR